MRKLNKKLIASILISATLCGLTCSCSNSENNDTNLERTVFIGLLEEVQTLEISEDTKQKINEIASVALDEKASISDILDAISVLNEIKSDFLDAPLVFVDSALKTKVCRYLGKSTNAVITVKDVLNIKSLDLSYTEQDRALEESMIHYISDLRKFPMLQELNLDGNDLYSLDGVEKLASLTELSLSGCFTGDSDVDITPLTLAENIEKLDLSYNNITSIAPLSTLKKLNSLDISGVKAQDLFVVAGFTHLTELGIGDLTANASILSVLTNLTYLDISNTVFDSTPNLASLTELRTLIANGQKSDITASISGLSKLKSLILSDCSITSTEFLRNLAEIEYLDISKNNITDASPIYGLNNLLRLNLSQNNIKSFSTAGLSNLLTLNISDNGLTQLHLLGSHNSIIKLNASNNNLVSVKAENMSGLTELDISNNPITDGGFFSEFHEIKKINADNTKFISLDLSHCKKLQTLSLKNVPLESTMGLLGLTSLQTLNLYGTNIADITAFSQMPQLKSLIVTLKNVTDYTAFEGLTSIENIKVYRMNNADWSSFNKMQTLRSIYIENSVIKEPAINNFPLLEELSIIDCPYNSSTSRIAELPNLKKLTIDGSDIASPTIRDLPSLESLILINSDVEFPEKIADLPQLKYLDLSGNDLEAVAFSALPSLEYLNVSNCRVVTIKDLNAEMSYGTLILANNYISDISVLDDIYKTLKKLDISNNRIKKYDALEAIDIEEIIASGNKKEYIPKTE